MNRKNQSRSGMGRACALIVSLALILIAAGTVSMAEEASSLPVKAAMLSSEESGEAANIFVTAMRNNFNVGRIIIDRILAGQFR